MKKNRMMRLASTLLILTLLTTSAVSGTFAKYTTSDSATDTARVAKWGVTVTATGDEAFAEKYDDEAKTDGTKVISSVTGKNVLAPGTKGTLGTVTISGKPEVVVDVKADVDLEINDQWTYSNSGYFPVVIKVGETAVSYNLTDEEETIEAAVEEAIIKAILANDVSATVSGTGKTATKQYAANNDFGETATPDVTVTWWWPFAGTETGAISGQSDVADTNLGNKTADDNTANDPTISFTCTVTVTQVD